MKYENVVKIGDVVKSLDFVGHSDCYRVGVVVAVYKDGTFCAETVKRVWQGKVDLSFPRDEFYAPLLAIISLMILPSRKMLSLACRWWHNAS